MTRDQNESTLDFSRVNRVEVVSIGVNFSVERLSAVWPTVRDDSQTLKILVIDPADAELHKTRAILDSDGRARH